MKQVHAHVVLTGTPLLGSEFCEGLGLAAVPGSPTLGRQRRQQSLTLRRRRRVLLLPLLPRTSQHRLDARRPREVPPQFARRPLLRLSVLRRVATLPGPTRPVPAHPKERQRDNRPRPRKPLVLVHARAPTPAGVGHRPQTHGVAQPVPIGTLATELAAPGQPKVPRGAADAPKGRLDDGRHVRREHRRRHPPSHGPHGADRVQQRRNPSIRRVRREVRDGDEEYGAVEERRAP